MLDNRLQKSERIYLRDTIRLLFASGDTFVVYPFRVVYLVTEDVCREAPLSILISVPKKRFKRATERNRVKRWVRESFRLQKSTLSEQLAQQQTTLRFATMMISSDMPDYNVVYKAMGKILRRLEREWSKQQPTLNPTEREKADIFTN